jgi:hypothetical protein
LILFRFAILRGFEAALAYGIGKGVDERAAIFPTDAGIGDALAVNQRLAGR